jgi:hypothetical protein
MAEQIAGRPWRWLGAITIVVGVMLWIGALLVAVAPRTSGLRDCGSVYQRSENSYSDVTDGGCRQAIEDGDAPVFGLAIPAGLLLLAGLGPLLGGGPWPAVGLVLIGVAAAVMYRYQWSSDQELSYAPAAVFFVGALALIAACCDFFWLLGRLQRSIVRYQSSQPA